MTDIFDPENVERVRERRRREAERIRREAYTDPTFPNPDEEGRVRDFAERADIPEVDVRGDIETAAVAAEAADAERALAETPRLRNWLSDPRNSAIARDDVDSLSVFEMYERGLRGLRDATRGQVDAAMLATPFAFDYMRANRQSLAPENSDPLQLNQRRLGQEDVELSRLQDRLYEVERNGADPLSADEMARLEELTNRTDANDYGTFIVGPTMRLFPQVEAAIGAGLEGSEEGRRNTIARLMDPRQAVRDSVESGRSLVDALGRARPTLTPRGLSLTLDDADAAQAYGAVRSSAFSGGPAGLESGVRAAEGYFGQGYRMERGGLYAELRREGLSVAVAGDAADAYAATATGIELVGAVTGFRLSAVGGLAARTVGRRALIEGARPLARASLAATANVAEGAIEQAAEESLQEAAQILYGEYARQDEVGDPNINRVWREAWTPESIERVLQAGYIGAQGGAGMAAPATGVNLAMDIDAVRRAERAATVFEDLARAAQASRTAERHGPSFEAAVDAASDGAQVWLDADRVVEHFQSLGQDAVSALTSMGLSREAVAAAIAAHGSIQMPLSRFAGRVLRDPQLAPLQEHARTDPTAATIAEARAAGAALKQTAEEVSKEMLAQAETVNETAQMLEARFVAQAQESAAQGGMSARVARPIGRMLRAMATTMLTRAEGGDGTFSQRMDAEFRRLAERGLGIKGPRAPAEPDDDGANLVAQGRAGPPVREDVWTPPEGVRLSDRERKIAEMAINGAGNAWIAEEMETSAHVVGSQLAQIKARLGGVAPWESGYAASGRVATVPLNLLLRARKRMQRGGIPPRRIVARIAEQFGLEPGNVRLRLWQNDRRQSGDLGQDALAPTSIRNLNNTSDEDLAAWYDANVKETKTDWGVQLTLYSRDGLKRRDVRVEMQDAGDRSFDGITFWNGGTERKSRFERAPTQTETARANRMFVRVAAAVRVFAQRNNPKRITFSGATEAHDRMYRTMLSVLDVDGYEARQVETRTQANLPEGVTLDPVARELAKPRYGFALVRADVARQEPVGETAESMPGSAPNTVTNRVVSVTSLRGGLREQIDDPGAGRADQTGDDEPGGLGVGVDGAGGVSPGLEAGQAGELGQGGQGDPVNSPEYRARLEPIRARFGQADALPLADDERSQSARGGNRGDAARTPERISEEPAERGEQFRSIVGVSGVKLRSRADPLGGQYSLEIDTPFAMEADFVLQSLDKGPKSPGATVIDFDLVDGYDAQDPRLPGVHIRYTSVHRDAKGTGVGTWLYRQLIDWADEQGLSVYSDASVSAAAGKVYPRLREAGYTVHRFTANFKETADGEVATDYKPIYVVSKRRGAVQALEAAPPPEGGYQIDGPSLRERLARAQGQSGELNQRLMFEYPRYGQDWIDQGIQQETLSVEVVRNPTRNDLARMTRPPFGSGISRDDYSSVRYVVDADGNLYAANAYDVEHVALRAGLEARGGVFAKYGSVDRIGDDFVMSEWDAEKGAFVNRPYERPSGDLGQPLFQPNPQLTALHNLTAENLLAADRLGGLPVPSIGIVPEGMGLQDIGGEITLIGGRALADPEQAPAFDADVWSGTFPRVEYDKVSSRKIEKAQIYRALRRWDEFYGEGFRGAASALWENSVNSGRPDEAVRLLRNDIGAMAAWLESIGEAPTAPVMVTVKPNSLTPWAHAQAWLEFAANNPDPPFWRDATEEETATYTAAMSSAAREAIRQTAEGDVGSRDPVIVQSLIDAYEDRAFAENGTLVTAYLDRALESARQYGATKVDEYATKDALLSQIGERTTEFGKWIDDQVLPLYAPPFIRLGRKKAPLTLDNVVEAMTSARIKGKQQGLTFGEGRARAAGARRFKTLEDMRRAAVQSIRSPEDAAAAQERTSKMASEWRDALVRYYGPWRSIIAERDKFGATWESFDASMRALARVIGGAKSAANMERSLRREGFVDLPPWAVDDGVELAKAFVETPVPYFESKPQRAVMLKEFSGAVVPEGVSPDVMSVLERAGITVRTYARGDRTAQARAAAALASDLGATFQNPGAEGRRGALKYEGWAPGQFGDAMVKLFDEWDASTPLHEVGGHLFHLILESMALDPEAPADIKAMWADTLAWWGVDQATWSQLDFKGREPYFERWARTFEAYLMEGKAPSLQLRDVFQTFMRWLLAVYRDIRTGRIRLNHNLSPEITRVFDRLLATDAQIAEARAMAGADVKLKREHFRAMRDEEWDGIEQAYVEAEQAQEADLRARTMAAFARKHKRWFRAEREARRDEAVRDVDADPARRAEAWLSAGEWVAVPPVDLDEDASSVPQGLMLAMPEGLPEMTLDVEALATEWPGVEMPASLKPRTDLETVLAEAMSLKRAGKDKQAQRLWAFIKAQGGIDLRGLSEEDRARVMAALGSGRRLPGLINNASGKSPEEILTLAARAGYFGKAAARELRAAPSERASAPGMDIPFDDDAVSPPGQSGSMGQGLLPIEDDAVIEAALAALRTKVDTEAFGRATFGESLYIPSGATIEDMKNAIRRARTAAMRARPDGDGWVWGGPNDGWQKGSAQSGDLGQVDDGAMGLRRRLPARHPWSAPGGGELTREDFLGSPQIVSTNEAERLVPKALIGVQEEPLQPFMHRLHIKMSPAGAAVYDGDRVIASYNFGDTLIVDPEYRRQGIAEELVYRWRTTYPGPAQAKTRTRASQRVQERVWDRIEQESSGQSGEAFQSDDGGAVSNARAQGYEGSDTGEAVEWLRAKAKGLDMSTEARMARAREMGFRTNRVLYHGTFADIRAFDPRRQRDPIIGPHSIYLSKYPEVASDYADDASGGAWRPGGNVVPVFVRGELATKQQWDAARRASNSTYDAVDALRSQGFAGVEGRLWMVNDGEIAIFSNFNIRSIHAAFDPDYSDSANLLAQDDASSDRQPDIEELISALVADLEGSRQVYSALESGALPEAQRRASARQWFEARGIDLSADKETIRAQIAAALETDASDVRAVHPDEAAPFFGFGSGDELVRALAALKPRAQAIEERIDAITERDLGDQGSPERVKRAALEAAHVEKSARAIEMELAAIIKAAGGRVTPANKRAQEAAADMLQAMTLAEIGDGGVFLAGERRAAKRAMEAMAKGDMAEAARQKSRQLLSFHLYRQALAIHKQAVRMRERWDRYAANPTTRAAIGPKHIEQIDAILDMLETGRVNFEPEQTLAEWVAEREAADEADLLTFNHEVLTATIRRPLKQLQWAEVQDVDDALKNIETIGRNVIKLKNAREAQRIADIQETLRDRLQSEWGALIARNAKREAPDDARMTLGDNIAHLHANLIKLDYLFRYLDGLKDGGPFMALMDEAQTAESDAYDRTRAASRQFLEIVREHYTTKEFAQLATQRIHIDAIDGARTKSQIVAYALNLGNQYNREALLKGEGWSEAQLQAVIANLDDRDWTFVQALWNYVGQWKEESFALDERTRGSRPPEVLAQPFTTPTGRTLSGGYWPVSFSARRSNKAAEREAQETIIGVYGASFRQAATKRGRLMSRRGTGKQALSDDWMTILARHANDSIRDITHRELVITLRRIKADADLRAMIARAAGKDAVKALDEWVFRLAQRMPARSFGSWDALPRYLRRASTGFAMGFKVSVATLNLLGHLQAIPRNGVIGQMKQAGLSVAVGFPDLLRRHAMALATGEKEVSRRVAFVFERSAMMRNRADSFDRDFSDAKADMVGRRSGTLLPKQLEDSLQILNQYTDRAVAVPTWLAAYESAMSGKVDGVTGEAAAVNYADSVVRMTISAGSTKDLAALIGSNNEWQRMFTMFMGWANTFYNQLTLEQFPGVWNGKISKARFAANMVWIWLLPSVITAMFYGDTEREEGEDEIDYWIRLTTTAAVYPLATVPFLRDVITATVQGWRPQTPYASVVERAQRFTDAVERQDERMMVKQGYLLAAQVLGLPSQFYTTGDYLVDLAQGEEDITAPDALEEAFMRDTR